MIVCGCLVDAFRPSQQFISHVGMILCLHKLNQCSAEDTKCASGESRTHDPSIPRLTLYQLRHLYRMNFGDRVLYFFRMIYRPLKLRCGYQSLSDASQSSSTSFYLNKFHLVKYSWHMYLIYKPNIQ